MGLVGFYKSIYANIHYNKRQSLIVGDEIPCVATRAAINAMQTDI